jgi:hypothetical protein
VCLSPNTQRSSLSGFSRPQTQVTGGRVGALTSAGPPFADRHSPAAGVARFLHRRIAHERLARPVRHRRGVEPANNRGGPVAATRGVMVEAPSLLPQR